MPVNAPRSTPMWTVVLFAALLCSACTSLQPGAKPNPADPWERMNRSTHRFNDKVDRAVLRPVAVAYRDHVPQFVRTGIDNALENLGYPTVIANQLLQGKLLAGLQDTGRFLLNSTLGVGGLLDPASSAGLDRNDEDFGQTLGRWGVPAGPYLVIPFMGPSTLRDTPTRYLDAQTRADQLLEDEVGLFREDWYEYAVGALTVVNTRAELLNLDRMRSQAFDEYAFVRDAWLQRREYAVHDGDIEEQPLEVYSDETFSEEAPAEGARPAEGGSQPPVTPSEQPPPEPPSSEQPPPKPQSAQPLQ